MPDEQSMLVIDTDGIQGWLVDSPDSRQSAIRLETGQLILVDQDLLILQSDGTYHLPFSIAEVKHLRIPVLEEQITVHKHLVPHAKVRISKTMVEEDVVVDEPLMQEEVQVEHVPVNRFVETPEEIRQEGETTIVPVMEEVVVITKRLLVREELHITKRQTETHKPMIVQRRREIAHVERVPLEPEDRDAADPRRMIDDPDATRPGLSNRQEGS